MPSHDKELVGCSACGVRVERRFAHRNRAGAYICRPCHARARGMGLSAELYERARIAMAKLGPGLAWLLGLAALAIAVAVLIVEMSGD